MRASLIFSLFVLYSGFHPILSRALDETGCPITLAELKRFRDQSSTEIVKAGDIGKGLQELVDRWNECKQSGRFQTFLSETPKAVSCIKNLGAVLDYPRVDLISPFTGTRLPEYKFAQESDDQSYLSDTRSVSKVPADFYDPDFYEAIVGQFDSTRAAELLETKFNSKRKSKWLIFPYRSREFRFDSSLMILIPESAGQAEQLIHFDITRPSGVSAGSVFIVLVTVGPDSRGRRALIPTGHWNIVGPGPESIDRGRINSHFVQDCRQCHLRGLKPILPAAIDPGYDTSFKAFSQRLKQLAPLRFADRGDSSVALPGLGSDDGLQAKRRTETLFKRCAPELTLVQRERVQKSMNCAKCHHDQNPATSALTYPIGLGGQMFLSSSMAAHLVQARTSAADGQNLASFILTGAMPPEGLAPPSLDERAALMRCLLTEYYAGVDGTPGIFEAWLKRERCE